VHRHPHTPPPTSLIRDNPPSPPVYGGSIEQQRPHAIRPSDRRQIVRFADKESHQDLLEPEAATPRGSMFRVLHRPAGRMQLELLRTLPGLERAGFMLRAAYASTTTTYRHQWPALTADKRVAGCSRRGNSMHPRLRGGRRPRDCVCRPSKRRPGCNSPPAAVHFPP